MSCRLPQNPDQAVTEHPALRETAVFLRRVGAGRGRAWNPARWLGLLAPAAEPGRRKRFRDSGAKQGRDVLLYGEPELTARGAGTPPAVGFSYRLSSALC